MGEPASKSFVFDAEGTADLMSGLRADLADLDYVASAFLLFAAGETLIPAIPERLGVISALLDGRIRMERADAPTYSASSADHHSGNARDRAFYQRRGRFENSRLPPQ